MSRSHDTTGKETAMDGRTTGTTVLALLALALLPTSAAAQAVDEDLAGPAMADAPNQFRISATGAWLQWDAPEGPEGQVVDDAAVWGVDLETRVHPLLAFRFGAGWGHTTVAGIDAEGASRSVDANQYVLELVAEPRLSVGPLRSAGVVPFGLAGFGSVVHDPKTEPGEFEPPLTTRSQGSLILGGGLDLAPDVLGSLGLRLEWRRAEVQMQDLFVSTSREGTSRTSDRFMGTVYLAF